MGTPAPQAPGPGNQHRYALRVDDFVESQLRRLIEVRGLSASAVFRAGVDALARQTPGVERQDAAPAAAVEVAAAAVPPRCHTCEVEIASLRDEVHRVGINVNQIARAANASRTVPAGTVAVLRDVRAVLGRIEPLLKAR